MKRFPGPQTSFSAGRRAVGLALSRDTAAVPRVRSVAPAQFSHAAAAFNIFSTALKQPCVYYSSQTSKAFSSTSSKAREDASATAAPVPGATAQMSLSTAAATKPTGSRSNSRSARDGKASAMVSEPIQQQQQQQDQALATPPSTTHHGRRTASTQLNDLTEDHQRHVKPMRGRRSSEQPRKRRNARQKAALVLHAHEKQMSSRRADASLVSSVGTTTTATAATPSTHSENTASKNQSTAASNAQHRRSPPSAETSAASKREADAILLTTEQLLQRFQLTSFVRRVAAQIWDWAASLKEWAHPSSDPTLLEWERQLLFSLRKDSFSDCSAVQYAMQQRYDDHFSGSSQDVAFLTLYARVLVNNAVFCLLNFVTYRATELLTEALKVAQSAYALKQREEQRQQQRLQGKGKEDGNEKTEMREGMHRVFNDRSGNKGSSVTSAKKLSKKVSVSACSASSISAAALSAVKDPEGHLAFLRVLLANAYASDQQYWKAAEQYQLVLSALERSPLFSPVQLAAGLVSPAPLNHTFIEEDARLFYADVARVDHAVSQGTAQLLLLQSQGVAANAVPLMHAQLAMARLHRHAGRYAESQSFYESYLDGATEHMEGEDVAGVMLELGRLLLYEERNEDAALVYLEAGTNMLLEDAQDLLDAVSGSTGVSVAADATTTSATTAATEPDVIDREAATRIAAGNTALRAAGGLVDTAMAFHAQGQTGKAIGLLEGCLQLLDAAGLRLVGGWVREQYADMLATVSLVDRALDEYTRAMEMLRHEGGGLVEQLGAGGRVVRLSASEVEGHLAFCLQIYVGDHKRAITHYRNVMQNTYRTDPIVKSAQAKLSKRARRQRAGDRARGGGNNTNSNNTNKGAAAASPTGLALKPDILHWVLSNYVACCERVEAFAEAVDAQNRLIEIEGALGGSIVESYLKLISLQQQSGEVEKTLALCFYVFYLPDAMMQPHTRLEVANCFASCCHQLGNNRMGAVLMQAVQYVRGDHDANALVHYAMCLKALDPADRLQLDGFMDIEASIQSIGRVFRRAASIVVADTVMDHEEETARTKKQAAGAAGASSLPSAPLWTHERVERVLNGLIVLSRGAFFFHQNRFTKDAGDLYAHALEQMDFIIATMPVLTDALQREMGILLVNYATLKAAEDVKLAATLYERAAAVCPSYLEVAEVVADFFVQSGDYAKGTVYMKRVLRANPSSATEMHLRLARLGTGPAWDTMSYGQRLEVLEHLLHGLGISTERITAAFAMLTQRQLSSDDANVVVSLRDVSQLLTDGVATATSEEAVCLATYIVQTRFREPQLLNRMYRCALLRFPQHATILVNYATLCMYAGYHVLARKYIAKAYAASSGDLNCTMCYAHYLCRSYDDQQVGCGESLYSSFLEAHPNSAQAHAAFANFMAGAMPTPFKTEAHFKRALELAPRSEDVVLQYGQFVWACTDSRNVYTNDEVRRHVFDRAEQLFREAVAINPSSFTACHQLGTFYAHRHNRFEEAMTMLYRAHKLQPGNVEVLRHILSTLHEECVRVQCEEQRQSGAAASQGGNGAYTHAASSRLRSLTLATHEMFENVLSKEPNDRCVLERYARFAVETLKDPRLAASLYSRIQALNRK